MSAPIRQFASGATRDTDTDKIDFEGFLSPLVIERFGEYMHLKRRLPDGSYRESDNWQLGIPLKDYMKSGFRHFRDWWRAHRGYGTKSGDDVETELCALIFNASGYLHELLKAKQCQEAAPWCSWMVRGFVAAQEVDVSMRHGQSHPMAAEALRDEYSRDDNSTGV
ncbi:hypothetical protein [Dyella sp. SG609]|uniref:hypothetical protein n=1 Tax=Dyella sp. SG609 TaxID=2587018 RepID=UPI00144572CD|nr:hypothetical protein [Dyella sp. SG609]NKJ21999.1 hypothetical protein [Dyella sp. SG609]